MNRISSAIGSGIGIMLALTFILAAGLFLIYYAFGAVGLAVTLTLVVVLTVVLIVLGMAFAFSALQGRNQTRQTEAVASALRAARTPGVTVAQSRTLLADPFEGEQRRLPMRWDATETTPLSGNNDSFVVG